MSAIGYGRDESSNKLLSDWSKSTEYKKPFSQGQRQSTPGHQAFLFIQPMPIPSYLLALVAGALEKRDISDRCAVWAESSMVEKAAWEFAETEIMLKAAEELLGPYRWGR